MSNRPTRIYNIFPLQPTVVRYRDASGYMCGILVLPGPTAIPQILSPQTSNVLPSLNPISYQSIVWWAPFPKDIVDSLVRWTNPQGILNNS